MGSLVCPNNNCAFRATSHEHQPNRVNWKGVRGRKGIKICQICEAVAVREGCAARKLVEFDPTTRIAYVYHLGIHKCQGKIDKKKKKDQIRNRIQVKGFHGTGKELAVNNIENILTYGTVEEAHEEAKIMKDYSVTKQVTQEDESYHHDQNSFDAVAIIKKKTDSYDPFYIYRINNGAMNNSSDYIFKSSREMIKLAIEMDVDGPDSPLQMENAYFNATHHHVHGFKSLGLWVYHPSMRKIIRLASMEIRTENTEDISTFFKFFNEIMEKHTGKIGIKFNP